MTDIVAITQARMSSTRLPGKSLREMLNRPMLGLMFERLNHQNTRVLHAVATSIDPSDDPIEEFCAANQIPIVRGSLNDVLARYIKALDYFKPKIALRLTGDNPIIDNRAVEAGLEAFKSHRGPDMVGVCNHLSDRMDPLGYCVEVFEPDALRWLHEQSLDPSEREHVTLGFKHRDQYDAFSILDGDFRHMRWTVDTPADFEYQSKMFQSIGIHGSAEEALAWSQSNPHPTTDTEV